MLVEGCYDGRVALVTGGGSGMGRAMAQEFARLGASVVVAGRRPEPLEETVALIEAAGGRATAQPTDVRDPDQVEAMVAAAVERFGRVDCLVNNAAGNFVVKGEDLSPNGWRAVVSIVLDGGFLCTRAAGRRMIAQGERRSGAVGDRELCVDGRAGDGALRLGQGRPAGDDQDAGGGVGAARDPAEHDLPGADRYRGGGAGAVAGRGRHERGWSGACRPGGWRRSRRSPGGRPRCARTSAPT